MTFLLTAAASFPVRSQTGDENSKPILVDEYGLLPECDFRSRMDSLLTELSMKPEFHGFIINYRGANELPEQRGSNGRETWFANHIAFRNFDASRITLLKGGYRSQISTELWIVAPGVNPPEPTRTVPVPTIPERSTFLFAKNDLAVDGDESVLDDYVLTEVKEREEEEQQRWSRESEAEQTADPAATEETSPETPSTQTESNDESETYVDSRTEEEKEAEKFSWADVGVARFIAERKGSGGLIIFYADDERYDIGKLRHFVETGRDRLADNAGIKRTRLKIQFGGYRESTEADFWFVPLNGKAPRPKPGVRPVLKTEEIDNPAGPSN